MEKLINILEDINPEIDYETCNNLVDDRIFDSLTILTLISEIEDNFDVQIPTVEIIPANFNSAQKIWELIKKLQEE